MDKLSLFFIESPLQLINAMEAVVYFKLTDIKYIIRLSNNIANDTQIIDLIKILNINTSKVEYITINTKKRTLFDYVKLFLYKYQFIFSKHLDKIFIGNLESGFFKQIMKIVLKEKIILLDDGSKTLAIQSKFTAQNNYNLFTMYDIENFENQIIYKNTYKNLISNIKDLEKNQDKIIFLGMKLSEFEIITTDHYLSLIKKIALLYTDKEIVYITHRGESEEKLQKILTNKNITIKSLNYPVELYGLYEKELPYKVASFYSTALITMQSMYKLEVDCYRFNYKSSIHKTAIDEVYNYYDKRLKVINLDD